MSRIISTLRKLKKYDAVMYLNLKRRLAKQNKEKSEYPDDGEYVSMLYKRNTGRILDLDNPKRFTEKLQWLKVYNHDPLAQQCADKYAVRQYVESKGYGWLLNDLLAVCETPDELNMETLPEKFVIKAAHSSAMNFICTDKSSVNWKSKKRIFALWLQINLYLDGREWVYKNIKPRLVVEKYLEDDSGSLRDYKFFCFNGKPEFIQADEDRYSSHKQAYYSTDWEQLSFTTGCQQCEVEKPDNFSRMLEIAADLSKDFPFVRVDLYNCNGRVYFGELTFFDGSGFYSFDPDKYDFIFGDKLELPEKCE